MHSFEVLAGDFVKRFNRAHFPSSLPSLYDPAEYFLSIGGKRVRPVMCLMGNELFGDIGNEAWHVAEAIELFHNFTLIHDDIMDNAPLRRGKPTVHTKYNMPTALLSGDVMLISAYDSLNALSEKHLHTVVALFNKTAREVCEGQQLDMNFEKLVTVPMEDYIHMITLKTSVLLAGSLQMGAILNDASEEDQKHLYEFGKNLGIAFQVQDDYLDAFGDPGKFGKQPGGDILANKKTFLLIQALATANTSQKQALEQLLNNNDPKKVEKVLQLFRDTRVDEWAKSLKNRFFDLSLEHLDRITVDNNRKEPLLSLAQFLIQREY
ncbi:MAG: polyprenyl synthetase family protein [Chitinophagaceae bacterium]|nr:polyprenyl synthetase family protein [Chitinophagaceae bacterium]MCW5927985.1 polyprenyl synthetase family protein [Chitinophagaceae bacterium]